jgi:hypothetical protein
MNLNIFNKESLNKIANTVHNEPLVSLYLETDHKDSQGEKKAKIVVKDLFKKLIEENKNYDKNLVEKLKEYEEEIIGYIDTNWAYLKNGLVLFI